MRQSRTAPYKTVRPSRPMRGSALKGHIAPAPSVARDTERCITFAQLSEENHVLRLHLIELEAALLNRGEGGVVYNLRAKYGTR